MGRIVEAAEQIGETRAWDTRAAIVRGYTIERSGIADLSRDFPPYKRRFFDRHVEVACQTGEGKILEFGGGIHQVAAEQLLGSVAGIAEYAGYEARPMDSDAAKRLEQYPSYRFIQGGLENLKDGKGKGNYDIAFAHRVAEHFPYPFTLVQGLYQMLKPGGILFVDGVHMHNEEAQALLSWWNQKKYPFDFTTGPTEKDLLKSGVTRLSLSIERTQEDLTIPIATDAKIKDFTGKARANHVYVVPNQRAAVLMG